MGSPFPRGATALAAGVLLLAVAGAAPSPVRAQAEETPEALPPGEAREEVFYACTACHNTAVIRRSRLSRQAWDDLMDWMTEKHGMNPLEGEDRRRIVDYLAAAFPPSAAGAGAGGRRAAPNPFLAD